MTENNQHHEAAGEPGARAQNAAQHAANQNAAPGPVHYTPLTLPPKREV